MQRLYADEPKKGQPPVADEVPLIVKPRGSYVAEEDTDLDRQGEFSILSACLGLVCFPLTICSCFVTQERQEAVILRWGRFDEQVSMPGCHWSNMWGREIKTVSVARQTIELPVTKIIDLHGNPLNVSAIVTFYFNHARKAALNVLAPEQFVKDQAQAIMKQVVSRYPYESPEGHASLKTESQVVGKEMVDYLQEKVNVCGAKIISFDLNEIAYAPEIASGMLRRQQAHALVAARKTIVDGAVEIATEALAALDKKGIRIVDMDDAQKTHLVTNLLTVICADKDAQPTVAM